VRYNPAVSKGKVVVTINPGVSYQILMTDSNTGVNFTCVTGSEDPNFYAVESVLLNIAGGGNGVLLQASRNTADNSCYGITISADSAYLD
jgi:hypothetical protein